MRSSHSPRGNDGEESVFVANTQNWLKKKKGGNFQSSRCVVGNKGPYRRDRSKDGDLPRQPFLSKKEERANVPKRQ